MDSVINAAVEEICVRIEDGLTLTTLWEKLQSSPAFSSSNLHLTPTLKTAIWTNLRRIPTLRFEPQPSSFELGEAEKLNTKIFPQQTLADNFVGLYAPQSLQHAQMRVLRLLANARANGITQTQLAKHLHIEPKSFHYVIRSLECQGLIAKHSATEKKQQISSQGESKKYPSVATHLVYLHRYAKQLASHQRFESEITKFNTPEDDYEDADGATLQTDIQLKKDYTPEMNAICDKLAKANGKVLLVSDIRNDLGYCGSRPRQRAWRQICQRLKADGTVEQFDTKVNGKIEAFLRLLGPITTGSGNEDKKSSSGKICQVIDQLVELPIEHQIFDIIDAAGSSGITLKEICERLLIDLKKTHIRLVNLCYRFGMKVQEEQCLKVKTIRLWISKNFNREPEVELISKHDKNKILNGVPDSSKIIYELEASTISGELADPAKLEHRGVGTELSSLSPKNTELNLVEMPKDLLDLTLDRKGTESHCKLVSSSMEADNASSGAFPSDINLSEKISYRDSAMIAKDLNIIFEQDEEKDDNLPERKGNSCRRRKKRSTELRPAKHARIDAVTDVVDMDIEESHNVGVHSGECATRMQEFEKDDSGVEGSEDCIPHLSQCVLTKMKPMRQRRFIWSDKTDRQLVIQYAKHRAALGARHRCIVWKSISDLPAPPRACKRRMNLLNSNLRFRKAVNRLCNMLSERYAKQLEKSQNLSLNKDDCEQFVRTHSCEGGIRNSLSPDVEIHMTNLTRDAWDDFENNNIKTALNEILRCKAKLGASSQKVQSQYEGWADTNVNTAGYESQENEKNKSFSVQSSRRRRFHKKFTMFLNNRANVCGQVDESLAVSNAVELFKLVFLSTSTGPQAPNLLADILRRYSENDLFAAFSYLKEKKIMVGGTCNEPFELSQKFLQSVSKSPFPFNTGNQAIKFSAWLEERAKDLTELGANLSEDLQCGDIFHLFALVSLGEFSISPCLPDNGVGEAEDSRSAKRKSDAAESSYQDKTKKPKSLFGVEGEIISRREKGFPGIIISAHRTIIPRADMLNLLKDNDNNGQPFEDDLQLNIDQSSNYSLPDNRLEIIKSCDPIPLEENRTKSPWEVMASYARLLLSESSHQEHAYAICSEVFRVVYAAIQKAGDQGLSMGEISQVINLPGAEVDRLIVDALQAFGQALKVNAYNNVRVVDALYRHKYFLTSVSDFHHRVAQPSSIKNIEKSEHKCDLYISEERDTTSVDTLRERSTGIDHVHRVTILNLPQGDVDPENQAWDRNERSKQDRLGLPRIDHQKETENFSSGELCVPILPWINGDGTINRIVYRGLGRRILGIVMQNPGILEDAILHHMHVLNPQNCRTLLELMILDKHLIVRKMHQNIFVGGSSVLQNLIGSKSSQPKLIFREYFFANPMSTSLL